MTISEWVAKKREAFQKFKEQRAIAQKEHDRQRRDRMVEEAKAIHQENVEKRKEIKYYKEKEKAERMDKKIGAYKTRYSSYGSGVSRGLGRGINMISGDSGVISFGSMTSHKANEGVFGGASLFPPMGKKKKSSGGLFDF